MRILHWYPNLLGGGAVSGATVGLALAQARAGGDVRLAAADEGGSPLYEQLPPEAERLLLAWRPSWRRQVGPLVLRGVPKTLRAEVAAFAPDVIHAHGEFNPDNMWVPGLRHGSVLVLTPHGAFDPGVFAKTRERSKRAYVALARRLLYRRLTSFHALSPREDEQVRGLVPQAAVYVLPQGGGPAATMPASQPSTTPDETTRLVFVGRLDVYTKGLDLLVRALAGMLRDPRAHAHLTLVGPDWRGGQARIESLAAELGVADALTLTGAVRGDRVAAIVDASDCVVQVSRHEGLSLSATEALVRGKPLILSRETGHASYREVADSPHVLLVGPDAAEIEDALRSFVARRPELVAAAHNHTSALRAHFSWERIGRAHLDRYGELLRGSP